MQKVFKVFLLFFVISMFVIPARVSAGTWVDSGANTYYTTTNGKVGIGTSNPIGKLSITGTDYLTNLDAIRFAVVEDRYWYITAGKYNYPNFGDYPLIIKQPADSYAGCSGCGGDLVFQPWRNTIFDRGNVGIGTASPGSYKLAVNGSVRAKSVYVDNSAWADYVFNDDYNLMSLSDLEKYVEQHNHLPGITPANEIENDGQNLGQIQTKQMEKIEELTLYSIQLNKENQSLKSEIEELKKQMQEIKDLINN